MDRGGLNPRYPFHKVKRAVLSSGNSVFTTALFWLATYGIETVITSKTGKLVATIVLACDDSRADTRIKQYEAFNNHKGVEIAHALVRARVRSEISVMKKHDLDPSRLERWLPTLHFEGDRVDEVRNAIQTFEAKCTQEYFKQ